nr:MAG TPA: ParE toxin of type II toxin-antitoxin system, parDE [Caudoviricetes sp.]
MVIKYKPKFERELKIIFDFIAKDSLSRAREFRNELIAKIERTAQTPFICRKSINFNDESIRDLIFKGYVIPYLIDDEVIYILGIYKANEWQAF